MRARAAIIAATLVLAAVLNEPDATAGTVPATKLVHFDSTDSTITDVQAVAFDNMTPYIPHSSDSPVGAFTISSAGHLHQMITWSSFSALEDPRSSGGPIPTPLIGIALTPAYSANACPYHGDDFYGIDADGGFWKDCWYGGSPDGAAPVTASTSTQGTGWWNPVSIPGGAAQWQSVAAGKTATCYGYAGLPPSDANCSDLYERDCLATFVEAKPSAANYTTNLCTSGCGTSEACNTSTGYCECAAGFALYQRQHPTFWKPVKGTKSTGSAAGTSVNTCVYSVASDSYAGVVWVIDAQGNFRSFTPGWPEGETAWNPILDSEQGEFAGYSSAAYDGLFVTDMQEPGSASAMYAYWVLESLYAVDLNDVISPSDDCGSPLSVTMDPYSGDLYWLSNTNHLCTWSYCQLENAIYCADYGDYCSDTEGFCG